MINRITTILSVAVIVALVACSQGTTSQGTLYSVNPSRQVEAFLPSDLNTIHVAAVQAVREMGYTIDHEAIDVREGIIEGATARNRRVRIQTFRQGDDITRIRILVGGDELASREVLDKIETAVN